MSLEPLIGAIAAGNIAVIKPSELAPSSSALLAKLIPAYLDTKAVKVVEGDSTVGEKLLQQKWEKIFFTGFLISYYLKKICCICNAMFMLLTLIALSTSQFQEVLELDG